MKKQYPSLLANFLPYIETSLGKTELLNMGMKAMTFGLDKIEQTRIPYVMVPLKDTECFCKN